MEIKIENVKAAFNTADGGSNRIYNLKRRAGLLVRKLKENKEISNELVKAIKDEQRNNRNQEK